MMDKRLYNHQHQLVTKLNNKFENYIYNFQSGSVFMLGSSSEQDKYLKHNKERYIYALATLSKLLPKGNSANLLDIGTSPFTFLLKNSFKNLNIDTIDYSRKYKSMCSKRNINFKQVNLNISGSLNGRRKYRVITFLEVLEHLNSNHRDVIKNICNLVEKGGYIIIQTPNRFSPKSLIDNNLWKYFSEVGHKSKEFYHFKEYNFGELYNILKNLKHFEIVSAKMPLYYDYPSSTLVYRKYKLIFYPFMYLHYFTVLLFPIFRRGMQFVLKKVG